MNLSDDLLAGAAEIGEFLFGNDPDPAAQRARLRRVYRLTTVVAPKDRLPVFRIGTSLYARRSTLLGWVSQREASSREPVLSSEPPPPPARRYPKHLPERYRR
jgi:hypothetical protein